MKLFFTSSVSLILQGLGAAPKLCCTPFKPNECKINVEIIKLTKLLFPDIMVGVCPQFTLSLGFLGVVYYLL